MNINPSATPVTKPGSPNPVISPPPTEALVRTALDDIALVVGSAAALHRLDDDLTWTLMKRLDRIRVRLLRDLKGISRRDDFEPTVAQPPRVHAAVDEFLFRNRSGMGE